MCVCVRAWLLVYFAGVEGSHHFKWLVGEIKYPLYKNNTIWTWHSWTGNRTFQCDHTTRYTCQPLWFLQMQLLKYFVRPLSIKVSTLSKECYPFQFHFHGDSWRNILYACYNAKYAALLYYMAWFRPIKTPVSFVFRTALDGDQLHWILTEWKLYINTYRFRVENAI